MFVRVAREQRSGSYLACLVRAGRPPIAVWEPVVAGVRWAPTIEMRSDGLWADHVCEEAMRRWGLGLEAFGLAIEGGGRIDEWTRGDRVPVGLDLEWETGEPEDGPGAPPGGGAYTAAGTVHGEILLRGEVLRVEAGATRGHAWGDAGPWWSSVTWVGIHWPHAGAVADLSGVERSEFVAVFDGPGMAGVGRRLVVLRVFDGARAGVGFLDAAS